MTGAVKFGNAGFRGAVSFSSSTIVLKRASPQLLRARSVELEGDNPAPSYGIPPPKRPNPMVPVEKKTGIKSLLGRIFGGKKSAAAIASKLRQDKLKGLQLNSDYKMLGTNTTTNILYWYCVDLSFMHSDFARLLPPPNMRVSKSGPIEFTMTRARNPVNLTKWMGYFLTFKSKQDALVYYKETLGSELCGMPLKLRFVDDSIRGLSSPLLDKVPTLSRKCHAIILGLPPGFSESTILKVLWDYDLINDDKLSVERLPVDKVRYGGSPFLLRFSSEEEAERFVHEYDKKEFPYSGVKVFCETVD